MVYQLALAAVIVIAYPKETRIDLTTESAAAQRLVNFFFIGQFAIASLMAPSFAAGAITGEKERKTYEMLLASPLKPWRIILGKLTAALTHLVVLIVSSLPIIMLCLPLGGVSIYELLAAYVGLLFAILLFGAISVFCSSFFKRTSSSLVVSYVLILPLLILGVIAWMTLSSRADIRLVATITVVPFVSVISSLLLLSVAARRLLYPPDIGSQGDEVVDIENEQKQAVGLVIQRDQFPDNLFAPPRRRALMRDDANPIYDKEMHAELFSQGTLMLRLVIQLSMILAIPLMTVLLFWKPDLAYLYVGYVLVFNILSAPVFTAGTITGERERQTLDLLLTTTISTGQILWGKLLAGYRVSAVLTGFLMFPMLLAWINPEVARNWQAMIAFFVIILFASVFNSVLSLFISALVRKTSTSLMLSYITLLALYLLPLALYYLITSSNPGYEDSQSIRFIGVTSPLMAAESVPMTSVVSGMDMSRAKEGSWLLPPLRPSFCFSSHRSCSGAAGDSLDAANSVLKRFTDRANSTLRLWTL
jgi:ABC-type transport system involved in multi-copper enzyme maturation permease subunit